MQLLSEAREVMRAKIDAGALEDARVWALHLAIDEQANAPRAHGQARPPVNDPNHERLVRDGLASRFVSAQSHRWSGATSPSTCSTCLPQPA
jgi:hypothetical protein